MKKEKFIQSLKSQTHLNLIGPIYSSILSDKIADAPVLFVDGGLDFKDQLPPSLENYPSFSIGDGDSNSSDSEIDLLFPRDKDQTDLQLALQLAPYQLTIHAWGFSGKRIDHYLANIGEFQRNSLHKNSICLIDDEIMILPPGRFIVNFEGVFSLLSSVETEVTICGQAKYKVKEPLTLLPLSGRTISNEANGDVVIESNRGVMFIPVNKSCSHIKLR